MTTDTTFSQLSELTGVNTDYIKDSFIPKLKELEDKGYRVETIQQQREIRRNIYYLPNPTKNFRIIWAELFSDSSLTPEEKGVLLAMQQYTSTNDGQFAITTKTNKELAAKMDISTKVLTRVFRQLEDKGILITSRTSALDKISGLRKSAKLIDLSLVCQAILFVNQKVDQHSEQIEKHSEDIKNLRKEIMKLKQENEKLLSRLNTNSDFNFA